MIDVCKEIWQKKTKNIPVNGFFIYFPYRKRRFVLNIQLAFEEIGIV